MHVKGNDDYRKYNPFSFLLSKIANTHDKLIRLNKHDSTLPKDLIPVWSWKPGYSLKIHTVNVYLSLIVNYCTISTPHIVGFSHVRAAPQQVHMALGFGASEITVTFIFLFNVLGLFYPLNKSVYILSSISLLLTLPQQRFNQILKSNLKSYLPQHPIRKEHVQLTCYTSDNHSYLLV